MTSHRRNDERLGAEFSQTRDRAAQEFDASGQSATTAADRNGHPARDTRCQSFDDGATGRLFHIIERFGVGNGESNLVESGNREIGMKRKFDSCPQLIPSRTRHRIILALRRLDPSPSADLPYPAPVRIVSLLPSTTEIVFQLGLADSLLGVTFECNFPPEARVGREIVVGGMDTKHLTPGEIDALVRERLARGDELYRLDEDALRRCDPDVILSQDLCRVCAVPSGDVDDAVSRLGCRALVLQIDPQTLDEVIDSVVTIAEAVGATERGRELVSSLHDRLDRLAQATSVALAGRPRPRIFVLEWVDPPFLGGHWVPDVVAAAGAEPVLTRAGARSVPVSWDDITAAEPDHVIVAPCGYGLDGAIEQARTVLDRLPKEVPVWAIDADAVMVRPGPRLVEGAEAIAAAVHGLGQIPADLIARVR